MSSTLGWLPIKPDNHLWLNDDLKYALRIRYGNPIHAEINESQTDYLKGLKDAGIKDAGKLIKAIEKYGQIQIDEVF